MSETTYELITQELVNINDGFKKEDIGKYYVNYITGDWVSCIMTQDELDKWLNCGIDFNHFDWE